MVKGSVTDESGRYMFSGIKAGNYKIKISAPGYALFYSPAFNVDSLNQNTHLPAFALIQEGLNLNEVAITTSKKLVEYKNGNITVNIEDSPLAVGNSVYDLLSRLPGVSVVDEVISIQGKSGVRVLINERLQQVTGQQLITLLKSMNAAVVEKIEILKNPPVKYDAAGTGFLSIKTKKVKITGLSGNANLSYNQGFYANKDAAFSLNYKGENYALFSSINGGNDEMLYTSLYNRTITVNNLATGFNQITSEKNSNNNISYNVGADWFVNKRNTLGFRVDGGQGLGTPVRHGNNYLSNASNGFSHLQFGSVRPNYWNYINYNLNAEHAFDTLNTTLRFSFDVSPNLDLNKGDFQNHFMDTVGNETLPARIIRSDNNLKFTIYSAKTDFEKQLRKNLKLETGVKVNNQEMLSNYTFLNKDNSTGDYVIDTIYTNVFSYKEQISAAYLNLQSQLKKFNFQAGLRGENTRVLAESKTSSVKFTRNYFNLFPLLSIDYSASQKHNFQLAFNRRINRPEFTTFNPYKFYVNLLVSFHGNPYMMPEYHNSSELSYNYNNTLFNTISVDKVQNIFFGYPIQNDSTKEVTNTNANLAQAFIYSYNFYLQKDIKKWWQFNFSGTFSYIKGAGKIDGNDYSLTSRQYYLFLDNFITLPGDYKIELNGQFLAPGQVVIYNNKSRWALNLAIRKSLFNKKLNVTVGVNDIFYKMVTRNNADYLNLHMNLYNTTDTRRFKVALTYNFGKVKVQQRDVKSNQEEKRRLNH